MNKEAEYWASVKDHEELLEHLDNRIKAYYDDVNDVGIGDVWDRSYKSYYGARSGSMSGKGVMFESSKLLSRGSKGEKTQLKANHLRNLIRHLHQLTTQNKRDIQARSANSDYASQAQTILANGLLDYYWRERDVNSVISDATELGLIFGESYVHMPWDPAAGSQYQIGLDGVPQYEGDPKFEALSPRSVIRDPAAANPSKLDRVVVRNKANIYDLTATYTDVADDILNSCGDASSDASELPAFNLRGESNQKDSDYTDLFIFYHGRTKSLPHGRLVIFLRDLVLFDGDLPYKTIPVHRLCAEKMHDTIYGYSIAFDLLGIQDGIDELHTVLMSNNKAFGTQNIWVKDTDNIVVSSFGGGMKVLKSSERPEPLQLTKSAAETYQYLGMLEHTAELLSGSSSTVRGNPEANLRSGNALALVVSQSIQFASSMEAAVDSLSAALGTGLFEEIRAFSQTKRVAHIVGESKRSFVKEFYAEDLSEINRVVVEQINPLSKTIAGRAEIANNLLQQGLITDPEKYIQTLTTGTLDPIVTGPQLEMLTIKAENEELAEGRPVQAVLTENHALHIREHKCVISSPDSKQDPNLVSTVLLHIQEHLDLARAMDPGLALILGQQPIPAETPPMMAPAGVVDAKGDGTQLPSMPAPPSIAPAQTQADSEQSQVGVM